MASYLGGCDAGLLDSRSANQMDPKLMDARNSVEPQAALPRVVDAGIVLADSITSSCDCVAARIVSYIEPQGISVDGLEIEFLPDFEFPNQAANLAIMLEITRSDLSIVEVKTLVRICANIPRESKE